MGRFDVRLEPVALLLVAGFVAQLLGAYPSLEQQRSLLIFAGAVAVGLGFGTLPDPARSMRQLLNCPVTVPALLYLCWTLFLCVISPFPAFARTETLRIVCGVCAYLLVVTNRATARAVVSLLLACAVLQCVYDFYCIGLRGGIHSGSSYSALATHQEVGAFLLCLLPFCVALAVPQKIATQNGNNALGLQHLIYAGTCIFLFVGLLLARSRSAWLGGIVACAVFVGIVAWYKTTTRVSTSRSLASRRHIALLCLFTVLAVGTFLSMARGTQSIISRVSSFSHGTQDQAMQDRFRYWRAGLQMIQEKPLTGWGPGSYTVLQHNRTNRGMSAKKTLRLGASHSNIAHSYYIQWAADTGLPGLAIHILLIGTFGVAAARCLKRSVESNKPVEVVLPLIAGVSAVAGTAIDAVASPAYNVYAISLLWWIVLGVATAQTTQE